MPLHLQRFTPQAPSRPMLARRLRSIALAIVGLTLASPSAAQTPLACGQVAAGAISAPGERDEFSFSVRKATWSRSPSWAPVRRSLLLAEP